MDLKFKKEAVENKTFKNGDEIYLVNDIDIAYNLTKRVIKDLTFNVEKGDFLSILGPNGAGKSTLIKAMCRIQSPSKGSIIFENKLVHKDLAIVFYSRLSGLYLKKWISHFKSKNQVEKNIQKLKDKLTLLENQSVYKPLNVIEQIQMGLTFNKQKKQEWAVYYKNYNIQKLEKKIADNQAIGHLDYLINKEKQYYKENKHLHAYSSSALAKRLAYVPQIMDFPRNIKVYDFVKLGRFPHAKMGLNQKEENEIIMRALDTVEMVDFANAYLEDLSGGQQQRCLIAMALAQDTDTIVLDEPTNHLDIKSQLEIVNLLHYLNHQLNKTIILVIHDLNYSIRYANKLLVLKHGQKVAFGDSQEVMTEALIKEVFGVNCKIAFDQNNRKFIEYSWLDNQGLSALKTKELETLMNIISSSPILEKEAYEKIAHANELLKSEIISNDQFKKMKYEILKKYAATAETQV